MSATNTDLDAVDDPLAYADGSSAKHRHEHGSDTVDGDNQHDDDDDDDDDVDRTTATIGGREQVGEDEHLGGNEHGQR